MAAPADADRVICALRLGWAVSELRGRLRPGEKLVSVQPQSGGLRADHALPLGGERTVVEQLIEAETVVCSLAQKLSLDVDLGSGALASQRLVELSKDLSRARETKQGADTAWNELAGFLYSWDARIQDQLAGDAFSFTSAYQLGRGLGDIAWLDPTQTTADVATSWTFVLGDLRVRTLKRLGVRLADYFQPHTGRGLSASLDVWQRAAADDGVRGKKEARNALVAQTKRWRDLLLTDLDPTTLLPPERFLARARQVRTIVHSFWPELLVGGAFALLAALGAAWLASSGSHHGVATLMSVLGAIGLTSSTLLAKAKNEAQDLVGHLRAKLDADLVRDAVTVSPYPQESPWWHFW